MNIPFGEELSSTCNTQFIYNLGIYLSIYLSSIILSMSLFQPEAVSRKCGHKLCNDTSDGAQEANRTFEL